MRRCFFLSSRPETSVRFRIHASKARVDLTMLRMRRFCHGAESAAWNRILCRLMRYVASIILASLLAVALPAAPRTQEGRTAFQDGYADVNGQRLHYASVGQGPLVLF